MDLLGWPSIQNGANIMHEYTVMTSRPSSTLSEVEIFKLLWYCSATSTKVGSIFSYFLVIELNDGARNAFFSFVDEWCVCHHSRLQWTKKRQPKICSSLLFLNLHYWDLTAWLWDANFLIFFYFLVFSLLWFCFNSYFNVAKFTNA